jgi:large subunit ribosomal protein L10
MIAIIQKVGEMYRGLVTADLSRRLNETADVILLNFSRLKSAEMTELRRNLKGVGSRILVAKNSHMRKAFEAAKKPQAAISLLDGPMAFVFVKDDPIATSKVLVDFARAHEALSIRGGYLSDRAMTREDVRMVAGLGSRQALLGQVASVLNAPVGKLARSLNQIVAKLVYALKAVSDTRKQ